MKNIAVVQRSNAERTGGIVSRSFRGLFRAFCREFEELRDKLRDPDGASSFCDGIPIEDAKELARFLNVKAHELKCFVCSEKTVIQLQWYYAGHQDSDPSWYDICIISGRRVQQKNSKGTAYVCRECLAGREQLRERMAKTLDPILQRFDALSL